MNRPTILAGVAGTIAVLSGIVAILQYFKIGPELIVGAKAEDVRTAGPAPTPQPSIKLQPSIGAQQESPHSPSIPATPAPPRLSAELLSANISEYDGNTYRATIIIRLENKTSNELKATWLDPYELINFTSDEGEIFQGPNRTLRKIKPTGLNVCLSDKGIKCWEHAPADFTTLAPGDTIRAVLNVLYPMPRLQRLQPMAKEIPGVFGAKLHVVDTVTGHQDTQILSQEVTLQNPNNL